MGAEAVARLRFGDLSGVVGRLELYCEPSRLLRNRHQTLHYSWAAELNSSSESKLTDNLFVTALVIASSNLVR